MSLSRRPPDPGPLPQVGEGTPARPTAHDNFKVRLSGLWLEDAGFRIGRRFEIEVSDGRLVLRTV